jgi:hypothetical protein
MLPGEYLYPIARTTTVHAPMVSGYVTARLLVRGAPMPPVVPLEEHATQFILENTGTSSFSLQMLQALDRSPSSGRTVLGPVVSLVPGGGHRTINANPSGYYIEFKATAVGAGNAAFLKAQVTSKLKWDILAFDKDEQPPEFNKAGYGVVT